MLQNLKIMTTLTTPQRVIIFGGSNAKRIVPFLLKLTKGKGIRVEDRTVSGHSLEDLGNFPKNTEVRQKDFVFILSGGNDIFEKHVKIHRRFGKVQRICLTKCVPNPLSSIQKLFENLKEKLKELKCHKHVITNPYRHLYCCPEHYDVTYFGNILRAQNVANSCLIKTLKEAAIILKIEKIIGLNCKEKRRGYPNHMIDSVHLKQKFYLKAAENLCKIVSEKSTSC
jgi:hypothetical protein